MKTPSPGVVFDDPRTSIINHTSGAAMAAKWQAQRTVDATWLFGSGQDALVLVDGPGQILAVSGQTEKMFGYRCEELVGQPVEKLMAERFRNRHARDRSAYALTSGTRLMETRLELYGRRKDGSEFPIQINPISSLKTDEGTLVSSTIRDISDLKRTQELHSHLEFESVLARLSKTFTNLAVDCVDGEITNGLKAIAEVLDLDRVAIILSNPYEKNGAVSHWWVREGIPSPPAGNVDERYPWLRSRLADCESVCVSAPEDLPEEAAAEREYMLSVGLKSWLAIPLQVGGEQLGRMSTGMFRRFQTWDFLLISRFQQAGDIFASALARKQAAEALGGSEERFRIIANSAPVMLWMSGRDKLCSFVNQSWLAFTGRTMEQEQGEGWASGVHPEDLNRCLEIYCNAFDARAEFQME